MGPKIMHKKGSHFINKLRFLMFLQFSRKICFVGVISGNIKPPGGLPGTNPWFLETQISSKSQGLKAGWSVFFAVFRENPWEIDGFSQNHES